MPTSRTSSIRSASSPCSPRRASPAAAAMTRRRRRCSPRRRDCSPTISRPGNGWRPSRRRSATTPERRGRFVARPRTTRSHSRPVPTSAICSIRSRFPRSARRPHSAPRRPSRRPGSRRPPNRSSDRFQRLRQTLAQLGGRPPAELLGGARAVERDPLHLSGARRSELGLEVFDAAELAQQLDQLEDAGLAPGADVEGAARLARCRGQRRVDDVGDIDVVAGLGAVAVDGRGLAAAAA